MGCVPHARTFPAMFRRLTIATVAASLLFGLFVGPARSAISGPAGEAALAAQVDTAAPDSSWAKRISHLIGRRAMSVAAGVGGTWLYRHGASTRRTPASNEKLLMAMSILDRAGPDHRMPTIASTEDTDLSDGIVNGTLWIVGSGNPEVGTGTMRALARKLKDAGIDEVRGRILGSTKPFSHDWMAPGWKSYFPGTYVNLPTALTFNFNINTRTPEKKAATALTRDLRDMNVKVTGTPGSGAVPAGADEIVSINSKPLNDILRNTLVPSSNFRAEVLGKLNGYLRSGAPGTIAKGAAAIEAFANQQDVNVVANDSSGLSYKDKVAPEGMVTLLWYSQDEPWFEELRNALPGPGQGTLGGRLAGVKVRAKTGTLTSISALSGWVWLERTDAWAAFSIISRGTSKTEAIRIEDAIVETLHERAA